MINSSQTRILLLLDYLNNETDEQHPITVNELVAHLKSHNIITVRKTIYSDIGVLINYGIDIVVIKSTQNKYFVGSRLFQLPELKMLVDAVESSRIISRKKTSELMEKLFTLTSQAYGDQLRKLTNLPHRIKPENEEVYYLVDNIYSAILQHRQIRFQYLEYTSQKEKILKHDGIHYILDPYGLEWNRDHYYLIGYSHKHKQIAHFRVDRLYKTTVLESNFQLPANFDIATYTRQIVDMYIGQELQRVTLLCDNDLMRVVIDHYGHDIKTANIDANHFAVTIDVHPSPTFYAWVFKFEGRIQIVSPESCIQDMCEIALKFI